MARRGYVDGPFGQMHYRRAGEGPALVCFHLSPMSSRHYERFADRIAAGGRTAVAIDTPGFGLSDAPPAPPAIADYSGAMAAAIEALALPAPIDVMGYHTGSMIACELAANRPDLVRRVICVSTPIFTAEERAALAAHYGAQPPAADGSHLTRAWARFHHHFSAGGMTLDQIADAFPEQLLGRALGWWGHAAAFAYRLDECLARLAQPVLVLSPDDDLRAETSRAAPLLRNGRIVALEGWGHGFLDVHTEAAARMVEAFLAAPDPDPFAAPGVLRQPA